MNTMQCDEGHPCKSCSNSNSECTFDEMHKKTIPHVKSKYVLQVIALFLRMTLRQSTDVQPWKIGFSKLKH